MSCFPNHLRKRNAGSQNHHNRKPKINSDRQQIPYEKAKYDIEHQADELPQHRQLMDKRVPFDKLAIHPDLPFRQSPQSGSHEGNPRSIY